MSDTPPPPPWHLLPHDPEGFFGLEETYDRRALRQKYGALIRRFKPEKHPGEFQRIRAAYETLLRFVLDEETISFVPGPSSFPRGNEASPPPALGTTEATSEPSAEPIATSPPERLWSLGPSAFYHDLRDTPARRPEDFRTLAHLADVIEPPPETGFFDWLLEGLAAFPGETRLLALLHAACRGPLPEMSRLPRLLERLAELVEPEVFLEFSRPVWESLARSDTPALVWQTLEKCERNLGGRARQVRAALMDRVLPKLAWDADLAFLDEASRLINETADLQTRDVDELLTFVDLMREYRRDRPAFLECGGPLRQQMDDAIRDYLLLDPSGGDRAVLECQTALLQDPDGVLAEFPPGRPVSQAFRNVWGWIAMDVYRRQGFRIPDRPLDSAATVQHFFERLRQTTRADRVGILWTPGVIVVALGLLSVVVLGVIIVGAPIFCCTLSATYPGASGAGAFLAFAAMGLSFLRLINRFGRVENRENPVVVRFWSGAYARYYRWIAGKCYRRVWRRELSRMLLQTRLDVVGLAELLKSQMRYDTPYCRHLLPILRDDFGLDVYNLSRYFEA